MDIHYYNSQIKDELDGAKAYICKAIDLKPEHEDWAKSYARMSEMELEHAKTLLTIFDDDFKMEVENGDHGEDYKELAHGIKRLISDMYSEGLICVEKLHDKYDSI